MRIRSNLFGIGLCVGALIFGVAQSQAAPVAGGFDDVNPGDRLLVTAIPGGYRVQESPGLPHDGDPLADFLTFVIQPSMPIGSGVILTVTGFGLDVAPRTAYLYDRFRAAGFAGGYPPLSAGAVPPSDAFDVPIGLSLGILFNEGFPSGIRNDFAQCSEGIDTGPSLTGCVDAGSFALGGVRSLKLASSNGQRAADLLVRLSDDNIDDPCRSNPRLTGCGAIAVVEPGSAILFGSGLMGLVAAVRRRRIQPD